MKRYEIELSKNILPTENDKKFKFIVEVSNRQEAEAIRFAMTSHYQGFGSVKELETPKLESVDDDLILKLLNREIEEEYRYVEENGFQDREYLDDLIHTKWGYLKKKSKNTFIDNLILSEIVYDDEKKYKMKEE